LKIKDLRYSQDTCNEVFRKEAPHLLTDADRNINKLRLRLGDDPDEVLNALRIQPEVVLHGQTYFSMNNRRAHCIKNCDAHDAVRILVKLYLSPQAYNDSHGAGAFEKYYTTTCEGQRITVTRPHYKADLAKAFGHQRIRESHFQLPSEDAVERVCVDENFKTTYNLLQVSRAGENHILIRGVAQRDVDLAVGFFSGRYISSASDTTVRCPLQHFPNQTCVHSDALDVEMDKLTRMPCTPVNVFIRNAHSSRFLNFTDGLCASMLRETSLLPQSFAWLIITRRFS
jgi:hypothetical protein